MRLNEIVDKISGNPVHRITREHVNSHSGQDDYEIGAWDKNNDILGVLEYSEFDGIPSIKMIRVVPKYRRKGVATKMVRHLEKLYPDKEIVWGLMTDEGNRLKRSLHGKVHA